MRSDTVVMHLAGYSLTVKALTLAEIRSAGAVSLVQLPRLLSTLISGKIGAFFARRTLARMPMRLLCRVYNAALRAQYGALLDCPIGWREKLALGSDTRTPFVRLCNAEAKKRLADNERSRLEYSIALLTSCVCGIFGGKVKMRDLLLPEGDFGKPPKREIPIEEQVMQLAEAMGATIVDNRKTA